MRALGVLVVFSVWMIAAGAWAQTEVGSDVVMLANGGRLRGTVEVYEPGADVVIVLSDGTRRTVPAAEVAQVIFGGATAPVPPPTFAPEPPSPPPTFAPAPEPPPPSSLPPVLPPPPVTVAPPASRPPDSRPPPRGPESREAESGVLPDVQHLGALESIAGVPQGAAREYAVEGGSPWVEDPSTQELPVGPLHFGLELRGAVLITVDSPFPRVLHYYSSVGGGGEISGVIDYRAAARFHLRAAAVLGMRTGEDRAYRTTDYAWADGTGMGTLGVRLMLGFDIARLLVMRIGGEVGGDYLPTFRRVELYGAPELDLLGQLLDGGNLEIGVAIAFPRTVACGIEASYVDPAGRFRCADVLSMRIQVFAGWVF